MALSQSHSLEKFYYLVMLRSFLIWALTLGVCLLIIGFPLVILMVTVGALLSVVLQSVMPVSAVLLVAGGLLGINLLGIFLGAGILTLKGVYPNQVDWLRWLHGEENPGNTTVYASCPLTCNLRQ